MKPELRQLSVKISTAAAEKPTNEAIWQRELRQAIRDPAELCRHLRLPNEYIAAAERAAKSFSVLVPPHFLQQIRPADPFDPLLRQVLPLAEELDPQPGFHLDPVGDTPARKAPGLIQKYQHRVLLMLTGNCAVHCRYCFRRHYPYRDEPRQLEQWQPAIDLIRGDESIEELILSGGDPLMLSDRRLEQLLAQLSDCSHLTRLRVHTRLPIMVPSRVNSRMIRWLTESGMLPYLVLHANHARELSREVIAAIGRLRNHGVMLLNQAVLLRGVNDSAESLYDLCKQLSDHGVQPYYLHQLDRVAGAAHFEVPTAEGLRLIHELRQRLPGYAVPRYVREVAGEPFKQPIG